MKKKHTIMAGILAGGLLLSANPANASMINGDSQTTSEAKTFDSYSLRTAYTMLYKNVLNDSDIQNFINKELVALQPMILKELQAATQNSQVEQKPVDSKPIEQKPVAQQPVEQKPVEQKPVAQQPVEQKPVEQKPVAQQPVAQKPVAQKPVAQKPAAQQPVTQKPSAPVQQPSTNNNQAVKVSAVIQQVVDLTNQERTKAGLKPLQIDAKLTQSAQAKSQDMKDKNYFDHTSPTYGSPFDQMKSFGISYRSAAENIAMGQRSATEVVNGWMNSPGHRANIMNPSYTHIGVGLSDSGFYWTQQFIGK